MNGNISDGAAYGIQGACSRKHHPMVDNRLRVVDTLNWAPYCQVVDGWTIHLVSKRSNRWKESRFKLSIAVRQPLLVARFFARCLHYRALNSVAGNGVGRRHGFNFNMFCCDPCWPGFLRRVSDLSTDFCECYHKISSRSNSADLTKPVRTQTPDSNAEYYLKNL